MEKGKHERVGIVVVAYIIGFTTAYIAFGVNQLGLSTAINSVASSASVVQSQLNQVSASVTPAGLVATINGEPVTLSATMADPASGVLPEGYNVAITDFALSPNNKYVYYCERPSMEVDSCRPYVYSIADRGAHPLTQNGARVAFAIDAPAAHWNADGSLTANGATSKGQPWQF